MQPVTTIRRQPECGRFQLLLYKSQDSQYIESMHHQPCIRSVHTHASACFKHAGIAAVLNSTQIASPPGNVGHQQAQLQGHGISRLAEEKPQCSFPHIVLLIGRNARPLAAAHGFAPRRTHRVFGHNRCQLPNWLRVHACKMACMLCGGTQRRLAISGWLLALASATLNDCY